MWPFRKKSQPVQVLKNQEVEEKKQPVKVVRVFSAGMTSRLSNNWTTSASSVDSELHSGLDAMRARSRDAANNNAYARKFLQMFVTNVVGPNGFILQSQVLGNKGKVDKDNSSVIEEAYKKWGARSVCDITGQRSFVDICRLFAETLARDGEVLMRRVRGKHVNKFGYALQPIDIDRLDVNHNMQLPNGNFTRMGVELDTYGRPVAYFIKTQHPGDNLPREARDKVPVERVLARDVFHCFMPSRSEQRRGIPRMHAGLERLESLGGFQEAAVYAARYGASKMGFYVAPDGNIAPMADEEDEDGEFYENVEPGMMGVLPKGYDFREFNPDYPTANFEPFVKTILQEISSAWGVSYHGLTNDLEGVNFSSIRTGVIEERDHWQVIQNWMIEAFLIPVFNDWLEMSLLMGALKSPNGAVLPVKKIEKFSKHVWIPRRWAWVDPKKDIETAKEAVKEGFKSRTQIINELGLNRDDVWQQLATEEEEMQRLGLKLGEQKAANDSQTSEQEPEDEKNVTSSA